MEIKDKLTARHVALQMATDVVSRLSTKNYYNIDKHIEIAKSLYSYIVRKAELPEVYNHDARADKLMDMLTKARADFKPKNIWFKIIPDNAVMRKDVPMFMRSKDGEIRVVGSVEDFDRIVESGKISDYEDYSFIFSPDPENPFERDRKLDPYLTATL